MLEITGEDIARLSDEDLRSLVGHLCEAELRAHGLPTSPVTWGGNQNAADGGIDVRVASLDAAAVGGFLPRSHVGFQVKKTDFTPGLIGPEMRPANLLRDSIKGLISNKGAYIIASSGSDTSDSALRDRLDAMRAAVTEEPGQAELHLDFYDRNRLASWIRNHSGLVIWVRNRVGRAVSGWQTYSAWAVSPEGVKDEYLLDEKARLHAGISDEKGMAVRDGIHRIRDVLRQPRGVVRLAGLSGVGKTRLVQALFDARIGGSALDPASAVYTDMNDNPSPQPTGMISDLVASRTRAIVVIDNCAPDLHRRITDVCRGSESQISAITVEYDVQDDEPEGTEVFRLEPSSVDLVAKLIARRFPSMTRLDVDRIANFSGGNARMAFALANTLEHHESVAGLQDEELFKRLFHQRQQPDDSLLKAAQACALLYSFEGETLEGDSAELPKIAALVGVTALQLFAKVAQLKQRDLVQRRSVWRAILPHAIANRLAKMALRETPLELVQRHFDTERLLKSFTRRLSFLHESEEARHIAQTWLAKDGYLAGVANLNDFGFAMFNNIAPISPEFTLAAIERTLAGPDASALIDNRSRGDKVSWMLRSIAYDAALFERCVVAMIPLVLAKPSDDRIQPGGGPLKGLFHILLSGTHASVEQRIQVVESLLSSEKQRQRLLGLELFEELIQSDHFSATHSFEFGARVRDYGYQPRQREESTHWFVQVIDLARRFLSNPEFSASIRTKIAQSLRGLWFLGPEVQEQFERIAAEIAAGGYWQEGWIAVRTILARPLDKVSPTAVERLRALERSLRPKNVAEHVRAAVLTRTWGALDFADMDNGGEIKTEKPMAAHEKANALAEELGKEVVRDTALFDTLLPELVTGDSGRQTSFGKGLALAADDRRATWDKLSAAVANTPGGKRNLGALIGFMVGLQINDPQLCETLLDEALDHGVLGAWFPALQTSVRISAAGSQRLKRAVGLGKADVSAFRFLGYGRSSDAVSGADLRDIVLALAKRENGYSIATDILSMRLHSDKDQEKTHPSELIAAGRDLLAEADLNGRDQMLDYHLSTLAKVCLRGPDGVNAAKLLCQRIKEGFKSYTFNNSSAEQLLHTVFKLQSRTALDVFFGSGQKVQGADFDVDDFDSPSDRRKNPLDGIPLDELMNWCDESPAERYPALAQIVSYQATANEGKAVWTPFALEMIKRAPNPQFVLETFVSRFSPGSWMGSRAAIIESRLPLLEQLADLGNPAINEFVAKARPQIAKEIEQTRKWENERDSDRDERFE